MEQVAVGPKLLPDSLVRRYCIRSSDCQRSPRSRQVTVSVIRMAFLVPLVEPSLPEQATEENNKIK